MTLLPDGASSTSFEQNTLKPLPSPVQICVCRIYGVFCAIAFVVLLVIAIVLTPRTTTGSSEILPAETRLFNLSNIWWKGCTIEVPDQPLNKPVTSFLFEGHSPPLLKEKFEFHESVPFSIAPHNYQAWGLFLNHDSVAHFNWASFKNLDAYVIQGDKNFTDWIGNHENHYKLKKTGDLGNITYSTNDDDAYYFILANSFGVDATGFIWTQFEASQYNTDSANKSCNATSCTFEFNRTGTIDSIVVRGPYPWKSNPFFTNGDTVEIRITLLARTNWAVPFWIITFAALVTLTCCGCCCTSAGKAAWPWCTGQNQRIIYSGERSNKEGRQAQVYQYPSAPQRTMTFRNKV